MAKITKRLALPVGTWMKDGEPQTEYRDIGVVLEFEDRTGNRWNEIRLHADALNPVLFSLAKAQMEKGSSSCRVKLFDLARKTKDKSTPATAEEPAADIAPDDIPF